MKSVRYKIFESIDEGRLDLVPKFIYDSVFFKANPEQVLRPKLAIYRAINELCKT